MQKRCIVPHELDLVDIMESHLIGPDKISLNGYKWFDHNQKNIHVNAHEVYGGVGSLVKNAFIKIFNVSTFDNSTAGILWLRCKARKDEFVFDVVVCL